MKSRLRWLIFICDHLINLHYEINLLKLKQIRSHKLINIRYFIFYHKSITINSKLKAGNGKTTCQWIRLS